MRNFILVLSIIFVGIFGIFYTNAFIYAQTADELRKSISDKTAEIQKIEAEIVRYKDDLNKIASLKKNLNNLIAELELTRKKLDAEIRVTTGKVDTTDLKIRQLNSDISRKQSELEARHAALIESLRLINERDKLSLSEIAASNDGYSGFWDDLATLDQFNNSIRDNIAVIENVKTKLEQTHKTKEVEKKTLLSLKSELADRKKIAEDTKKKNLALLTQTKKDESTYAKLLKQKEAQKEAFEKELRDYESTLKFILDPTSIPPRGVNIFSSPLGNISITQQFGRTSDSRRLYASGTHNGTDFRASVGTPIKSVLDGVVSDTGNTDQFPGCYSYGKWVLVKHSNGLSTLYAHLSLIKVSKGQSVTTGELLGYSGNTGYSTGPHLHLTVFVSEAVQIIRLGDVKKGTPCANAPVPIAATNAYLDPMDYL
ncbi:MAG: peptidoglycan DD-metalloendopeptidase family protein [Patescibacteria group bacterium]